MRSLAAALAFGIALCPAAAAAQNAESLFNGKDLRGWKTDHAKARVRQGVISVEPSKGWLRTERALADFVLTLEARMTGGGQAGVFVRSWPTFDRSDNPDNAFPRRRRPLTPLPLRSCER